MFGGIVEATGRIIDLRQINDCIEFKILPEFPFNDLKIGDSVAVNGTCLTVTSLIEDAFTMTAVPETLRLTNLDDLTIGSLVNLERSLPFTARIGGHFVQGHVDFCGEIIELSKDGDEALLAKISYPASAGKYLVRKGYVGIDGMSITLIDVEPTWFSVTFIPHTQDVTIVKHYQVGKRVNIEVDILGKYIAKQVEAAIHARV